MNRHENCWKFVRSTTQPNPWTTLVVTARTTQQQHHRQTEHDCSVIFARSTMTTSRSRPPPTSHRQVSGGGAPTSRTSLAARHRPRQRPEPEVGRVAARDRKSLMRAVTSRYRLSTDIAAHTSPSMRLFSAYPVLAFSHFSFLFLVV